jgi:photosystem II stability/assembly factor-like uncharacterized protein
MPKILRARTAHDEKEEQQVQQLAASQHGLADWIVRVRMVLRSWDGLRVTAIAAAIVVPLLVGSLIVIPARSHQLSPGGSGNMAQQSGVLSSLHMVDAETGWAVTEKGCIVRTTDGGVHWQDLTPKYPSTLALSAQQRAVADFLTSSIAWVAVSDADAATTLLLRTADGGQTWQTADIPTATVTQITFITSQLGWMLAKFPISASAETIEIYHTADGGKSWVRVSVVLAASTDAPPLGQLPFGGTKTGLGFLNATTGWATGSFPVNGYPFLYTTRAGGGTWDPQTLPLSAKEASSHLSINPPRFFTAIDGLLPVSFVTESGPNLDVYVTHDGGTTWQGTVPVVASISAFMDVNHGWASDGTRLYRTRDGGQHWTKLSPGVNLQHVSSLDFVSSDIGWASGSTATNSPAFFKTVDGGHTWTVIPSSIS